MGLANGTKLGPYLIQSPIGSGGMGEVYRARDSRLERDVAIKVLPANLSTDPSLRQRLEREAKAVSRLSHPHICTLYDIGHQDGVDFIVMELVQGETVEERLRKGPLPSDQTIRISAQIAGALARAHKLGIVHRDLKPANVMLTKSGAKLMDFGLAKESSAAPLAAALTEMTADQAKLTVEGTIVGTFQYMAPEQLEGKEADARTDIFALGELIHEMATAQPAFSGNSRASLIAAILTTTPPPISSLQPLTPLALERVVKKCLAKDPDERWQSASDLATELSWISESGSQAAGVESRAAASSKWLRAGWIVASVLLLLLIAASIAWWPTNRRLPAMYFHAAVPFPANDLALSPDQRTVAMVAYSAQANDFTLWTYEIGGRHSASIEGTQGASYPFWSPDGNAIGFFADGKLKKVDLAGGQPQVVCDAPNGRGGTWNHDGVIVFSPDALGPLFRVSALGGSAVEVDKLDKTRFESSHRWPVFLPDGKHFIYLAANFSGKLDRNAIFLGSLDSADRRLLVSSTANAAYAEPGYLIYLRDKSLVAQRFDQRNYSLSGDAHLLSNEVLFLPQVDRAIFSVSSQALITQNGKGAYLSQLTWFDRNGKNTGVVGQPGFYDNVRLSPDGHRVAADQSDTDGRNIDVWVHEVTRGTSTRLTFDPALDQSPIWSADSQKVLFTSNRSGAFCLYLKNADGSGTETQLLDSGAALFNPWDWSRDGKYILFRRANELGYVTWPDKGVNTLVQAKWTVRGAQFSPDEHWVAYSSNETGNMEIYVSPFPSFNGKWQVSNAGGQEPKWRSDGKELFYVSTDGKIIAVPATLGTSFEAGTPVALFQTHRRQPMSSQDVFSYDVSGDGQRFLVATKLDEPSSAPLSVLLNWTSEIEK